MRPTHEFVCSACGHDSHDHGPFSCRLIPYAGGRIWRCPCNARAFAPVVIR